MIKTVYYYLFYKIYKFWEKADIRWWSDWKASLTMDILIVFMIMSIETFYRVLINPYMQHLSNGVYIVLTLAVAIMNYFIFDHSDRWKVIIERFDRLPKRTNRIGGWIVFGFIMLVLFCLIFSFYLMSQIDWSLYR